MAYHFSYSCGLAEVQLDGSSAALIRAQSGGCIPLGALLGLGHPTRLQASTWVTALSNSVLRPLT